jgi:hypothetical protein
MSINETNTLESETFNNLSNEIEKKIEKNLQLQTEMSPGNVNVLETKNTLCDIENELAETILQMARVTLNHNSLREKLSYFRKLVPDTFENITNKFVEKMREEDAKFYAEKKKKEKRRRRS